MYCFGKQAIKLLESAVSAVSIRLYVSTNRCWNITSINLGNGPVRPKVQGSNQARDIHRKESQSVDFPRCYSSRLFSLAVMPGKPKKVCIVGSGNWGSAIAKIVGNNALRHDNIDETVTMYVYEEIIDGKKLTEIINEQHENVKYLPGIKLPPNVADTIHWNGIFLSVSCLDYFKPFIQYQYF
ncbi:hypothetical protein L9F63_025826, partial [Diploptera punctata]